ncbi:MAG: tRNA-dihydrouridine synthase family protein [Lachnospiraceae bacterium]|nr:tRNA-dihydrouridine synthase family protein [Lachnospiraceae bacterium]
MKFYFAPMEGVAGYIYRNTYNKYFNNIDKFFAPFISTSPNGIKKMKEFKDILPENNMGINIVPQLLSNSYEDFVIAVKEMKSYGYNEINLNVGCPSGTVTSKKKGAGMLLDLDYLDKFLDFIFEHLDIKISVKTRIGYYDDSEVEKLIEIYNNYPIYELIVHPRTREDFYKNKVDLNAFEKFYQNSKHDMCFNGDIFSYDDYENLIRRFPKVNKVMLGRGILRNPSIVDNIKNNEKCPDLKKIFEFHDDLFEKYKNYLSGEIHLLFKMKEVWLYMVNSLEDSEKYAKKIKKIKKLSEYRSLIDELKYISGVW